jgi:small subunit ribosomal protein S16
MLAIRMQRTGRKGHAMFRVIVQDSRRTPTSGNVVALLGSYDPHFKIINLEKDKAQFYLDHGAQPSNRVAALLKSEGVKLPKWVTLPVKKQRAVRNPEKRRSTAPEKPSETPAELVEQPAAAEPSAEVPIETPAETKVEEPVEQPAEEPTES